MPLDPLTWPLPYTTEYKMNLDSNGNPSHYTVTIKDKTHGWVLTGNTSTSDPMDLNRKIKELSDEMYP